MDRLRFLWRAWRYRLRNDPGEIRSVREHLSPGDTAIDIGAHKGAYTYWMARSVGPAGRVVAFEPQPELASYLKGIFRAPGWRSVTVEAMALSSGKGRARLVIPARHGSTSPGASVELEPGGGSRSCQVDRDSLDVYCGAHPDIRPARFVKCDVEGHELEVFRGAETVLREDAPVLLFECEARHRRNGSIRDVFRHLEDRGYEGRFFLGRRLRPLSEFDEGRHQRAPGSPAYCNNFLFTPKGR